MRPNRVCPCAINGSPHRVPALFVLALFNEGWHLEIHAVVVVNFVRGGEIQIGEEDLVSEAAGEVEERVPDDGIVFDVGFVAVLENQGSHRLRDDRIWWRVGGLLVSVCKISVPGVGVRARYQIAAWRALGGSTGPSRAIPLKVLGVGIGCGY